MNSFTHTSNREWPLHASYHLTRVPVKLRGDGAARGNAGTGPGHTGGAQFPGCFIPERGKGSLSRHGGDSSTSLVPRFAQNDGVAAVT
jgi:hypothetical protein